MIRDMSTVIPHLPVTPEQLESFCRSWDIVRLEVFGSALTERFDDQSDVDVLVTFAPERAISLFTLVTVESELSALFERKVDLVQRESIEESPNWIRRKAILDTARVIYAAA
jgi:predicted nucleotidyltransferase